MRMVQGAVASLSLVACLVAPFLYLGKVIGEAEYKNVLLAASGLWFVFGTMWVGRAGRR